MAENNRSIRGNREQPWPPRIAELATIFKALDSREIIARLKEYRPVGRRGHPIKALWQAYVASYHRNLPHTNALIRELEDDRLLREVCGFDPDAPLPDRRTFNRFIRRLANHASLVEACIDGLTTKLKAILPDLGREVAIDASSIPTYSNHRKGSDPEATWGYGHSTRSRAKDSVDWAYGYKLHMIVDANYGIPLSQHVTTGKVHESKELPPMIDKAKERLAWFAPVAAMADRGYDSAANHQSLWFKHSIIPVIHIRKPSRSDLYQGIYTKDGVPTCMGLIPMKYVLTDRQGFHLYRCPGEGCHLKDSFAGATRHCDTIYLQDPSEDIRLFGVIRRASSQWKALYAKRWAVERLFKTLKQSRRLTAHCVRGLRHINLHALMSTLAFQATALMQAQAGNLPKMRWMVREVA